MPTPSAVRLSFPVLLASVLGADAALAQGFHGLYTRDGIDVWAVGDAGLVHRSFDGGATWTVQNVGTEALRGAAAAGFTVITVAGNGEIRRSGDSGGSWSLTTVAGNPTLRDIALVDASTGYVVGDAGTILKTTDGGSTWSPQVSGTAARLHAVRFTDAASGWAAGDGGTLLRTTDGGTSWTPVAVGTAKHFYALDVSGASLWVAGQDATAFKSADGSVFTAVNLGIDSRSDVTGVWMDSPTSVVLTGGGGFVRKSTNGGSAWTFFKHNLMLPTSDIFFFGAKGWVCSDKTQAVLGTTDGGTTWVNNGTMSRSWSQRQATQAGSVRGATISQNGQNKNSVYGVLGVRVYKSADRGDTWTQIGSITGGGTKTNAFYVSPLDSMLMVAAVGTPDRISRSTDGGTTWVTTKTADFTEYGVPLELNPDKPNELVFGPEDGRLWLSDDFGATWSQLSNPGFRSPCDIQIVHDSTNVIYVGDGVTGSGNGQMFRSTDAGLTFSLIYNGSGSEIPMISAPRLQNSNGLATHWSSGGVRRTTDYGASWQQVHTAGSAWGCDYAKDDPNVVVFGVYSGGQSYISLDGGATGTWSTVALSGTNYAFHVLDRATLLAQQAAGFYKLSASYTVTTTSTQAVTVLAPNGGEVWTAGEVRSITWNATNVGLARLEYRRDALSAWEPVADVEGYAGTFAWTVPPHATTAALVRVRDAWDANPEDESNATFTILAPALAAAPATLDFGPVDVAATARDSVQVSNTGTATLDVDVTVAGDGFAVVGPTSFSVGAGLSAWVVVAFQPTAVQAYAGTLTLSGNVPAQVDVPLAGAGVQAASLALLVPDGGESWRVGTTHDIQWSSVQVASLRIEYRTNPAGPWAEVAASTPAAAGAYAWTIPNTPTSQARVRLLDMGGAVTDSSSSEFRITVPVLFASPDTLDIGPVTLNSTGEATLYLTNPGTAPVTISAIESDRPEFHPGRTALVVPAAGADTVGMYFTPTVAGPDAAKITLRSDDPHSPYTVIVRGTGVTPSDAGGAPSVLALGHAGTNPFRGRTVVRYSLPEAAAVTLEVFDTQGRRVALLARGPQEAGVYAVPFGSGVVTPAGDRIGDLAAGLYFVRLLAGSSVRTSKLVLAR